MKAEIFNIRGWINETNPEKLKEFYSELLDLSGFEILNFHDHYFEPFGWSGLWLLGESHFAIHTFPEENKSYIELSSCNKEMYLYFVANIDIVRE
jgi:S-adenosylmethionine decarboxylase